MQNLQIQIMVHKLDGTNHRNPSVRSSRKSSQAATLLATALRSESMDDILK